MQSCYDMVLCLCLPIGVTVQHACAGFTEEHMSSDKDSPAEHGAAAHTDEAGNV